MRIIAGSGRSGTTWVLDAMAEANSVRPIFEPLNTVHDTVGAFADCYVDPGKHSADLRQFFERLVSGEHHSLFSDFRVRPERLRLRLEVLSSSEELKKYCRRWEKLCRNYGDYQRTRGRSSTLIKIIRGNLMLGWLSSHFNARILLLIRHPGAVVESQLRLGNDQWEPYTKLEKYRSDLGLSRAYLEKFSHLTHRKLSLAQAHTLNWCIENQIPLLEAEAKGYTVIFYESLFNDPQREWQRAAQGLDLQSMPSAASIARPSQQASSQWRTGPAADRRCCHWLERISPVALEDVDSVLREMQVKVYDAYQPLPIVDAAQSFGSMG